MGLLDNIGNRDTGGLADLASQAQGNAIVSRVFQLINDPRVGGLSGLVQTFQSRGFGGIISSWVGTGTNQPISPQDITHALGADQVEEIARNTGTPISTVAGQLATLLPTIVDKLTPNGTVPDNATLANALSMAQSALNAVRPAQSPPPQ